MVMDLKILDIKYIVVFIDYLEEFLPFISSIKKREFNYLTLYAKDLDNLAKEIKSIERENILMVVSYELFIKEDFYKKLKSFFIEHYSISNPHLLVINPKSEQGKQMKFLDQDQTFYYHIPEDNTSDGNESSFYFFIKMVFNRMRDIARLDNYIINSFRTIIDSEIMKRQKQEIEKLYKELAVLSRTDYLTKVLNRKAFFEAMELEINRTIRSKEKVIKNLKKRSSDREKTDKDQNEENKKIRFSCIMIDIDHFKKINDTYGHISGDAVLKGLGNLLKSKKIFRTNDIIGRYGGEEFIIILPDTNSKEAKIPAERLRDEVAKMEFTSEKGEKFGITISIGISEFHDSDKLDTDIINRADKALYYAKSHGRNQTVVYEDVFKD